MKHVPAEWALMISIRKLAEMSGISPSGVWRVLHNEPGVSPEVRARILALAEEYHYHPNRLVEGLISGKTRTIGYISEDVRWYYCAQISAGIIEAALRDQVHVIILNAKFERGNMLPIAPLIDQLIEQRVDGIIISAVATPHAISKKSVLEMWSHDIVPVLIGDTISEKSLDRVIADERRIAQLAVEYLLHLGHQRIAYCGLSRQHLRDKEVYRAMQSRGLSLKYFSTGGELTAPNMAGAEAHLDLLLRRPFPPTAILCFEDHIAAQLLLHAQQRGLSIPGDLSILGCANDVIGGYLTPALTSIEQHPEEIGRRAYELIQRRHREEDVPGERRPETIFVPPGLIIRASCGPPAPGRGASITGMRVPTHSPDQAYAESSVNAGTPRRERRLSPRQTTASPTQTCTERHYRRGEPLRQAMQFLRTYLSAYPAAVSTDVLTEAKRTGISVPTLRRAKDRLGITVRKSPQFQGAWTWSLPATDS